VEEWSLTFESHNLCGPIAAKSVRKEAEVKQEVNAGGNAGGRAGD
jgi:hypothetical protein